MGSFSPIHWIVIGIVALLLFGNRLPEVARSMGRAFKEFKRGLSDVSGEFSRDDDEKDGKDERNRRRDELDHDREERGRISDRDAPRDRDDAKVSSRRDDDEETRR